MEPGKLVWLTNEETGELIDYFGAAEFLMGGDEPLSEDMLEEMREAAKMLVINLKPRYMFKPVGLSLGQGGISAEFSAGRSLMLSGTKQPPNRNTKRFFYILFKLYPQPLDRGVGKCIRKECL